MATDDLKKRLLSASQGINAMGRAALADSAPAPLLRILGGNGNVNFTTTDATPSVAAFSGKAAPGAFAGVNRGNPNTVQVMDRNAFAKPGQTGQLAVHEAMHIMQNNLPPKVAAKIPADDPNDPYNFGGEPGLIASRKAGQTLLDKPREQQAAILQYWTAQNDGYQQKLANQTATAADHAAAAARQKVYGPWIDDLNNVPQSVIMPTAPDAKGNTINTQVRPLPGPPTNIPGATLYATQMYKPGQPAPVDDLPPGATVISAPADDQDDLPPGATVIGQPAPQASWGSSLGDIGSVIGQRLKNAVAGPYTAFTSPATPQEQQTYGAGINSPLAHLSLGVKRMFVDPTTQAAGNAVQQFKQGKFDAGMQSSLDAIPVVGPWARQVSNDAQQHGAVAAMTGLATDVGAPAIAAKAAGVALGTVGKGAQLASTTPANRALAVTRAIVPGSPEAVLTRALKPPVTMPDFEQSAHAALPDIAAQSPAPGVKGFASAAQDAADNEQSWYKSMISPYQQTPGYGTAPRSSSISGAPIARAQMNSIPITNLIEDPSKAVGSIRMNAADPEGTTIIGGQRIKPGIEARTAEKAQNWNRNFDVPTLDAARQDLNAKLNSFWNQSGGDRAAARSNPEVARTEAASNATRDALYPQLSKDYGVPEETIRSRQTLFGNLSDVADVANRRATVYGRQSPLSLQESLAVNPALSPRGIATAGLDFVGQRLLKNATGSDALVNSALDRFKNPAGTPLPPARGLFPSLANTAGRAASALGTATPLASRLKYLTPGFGQDDEQTRQDQILKGLFAPAR